MVDARRQQQQRMMTRAGSSVSVSLPPPLSLSLSLTLLPLFLSLTNKRNLHWYSSNQCATIPYHRADSILAPNLNQYITDAYYSKLPQVVHDALRGEG